MAEPTEPTVSRNVEKAGPLLLELTQDTVTFLLKETGLTDENELGTHVLRIQDDAVKVCLSPAIVDVYVLIWVTILAGVPVSLYTQVSFHQVRLWAAVDDLHPTVHLSRVKILELPWYDALLQRGKERGSALLLDVGCACKSYDSLSLCSSTHGMPCSWY